MAAILLSTVVPASAGYDYDLNIYINGTKMSSPDQRPYIDTDLNRVYVPVRFVTEAMGATVDWSDETQTAVIKRGDTVVKIKIGSNSPLGNDSYMHGDTLVKGVYGIELVCFEKIFNQLAVYYTACRVFGSEETVNENRVLAGNSSI